MVIGLVTPSVLDITKLEKAHRDLVHLWPALGGTLIATTTPYSFTSGSIVDFSARYIHRKLSNTQEVIQYTETSSSHPTFHHINDNSDLVFHFDTKNSSHRKALFVLRVTILTDATLLGFKFVHHLCDGESYYDVAKAYCNLLSGRPIPQLIPPPDITSLLSKSIEGEDNLPFNIRSNQYIHPKMDYTIGYLAHLKLLGLSILKVAVAKLMFGEKDEHKMIHLPVDFVAQLRKSCQDDLEEAGIRGELSEGEGVELTKNDVITAWLLKNTYAFQSSSDHALDVCFSFNYRPLLPHLPPNQLYLHNSVYGIRTPFPSLRIFQSLPLWRIALEQRLTCIRNKQPSAVKSTLQFFEENTQTIYSHIPPDRPLTILNHTPLMSHWTRFDYNSLDFSAARVEGESNSGKVAYYQPGIQVMPMFAMALKPLTFVMKDGQGGYWLRLNSFKSLWEGFRNSLEGC
ncbi:hypothetical protein BDQ17DRAFT_1243465 [Cyathus striatus]|nr:hypothetical protein BDQ17DRAFT_1243465 [Cyathus striatus]